MLFIKTFPPKAVRPRLFAQDFFAQDFSTQDFAVQDFSTQTCPLQRRGAPFFIDRGQASASSNAFIPNKTTALPIREAAAIVGCRFPDQLLRRPSAARFHCDTLSAIMRVDFMAAWLSWA